MIVTLKVATTNPLQLKTNNNLPHEKSPVEFDGSDRDIQLFKSFETERGLYGHDGHRVTLAWIANVDLIAAVHSIPEIKITSISPQIKPDPLPQEATP